jgi:hypothetical protein
MARERRDAARRLIADGKDPSAARQAEKQALKLASEATFEKIGRHYLAALARKVRRGKGSIKTYRKAKWMLETFIFSKLGDKPIGQITRSELLVELKKIEAKGLLETVRFGVNGEWQKPRVLQVQFQDIEGDGIAQFGNGSRQVVVSPPAFAAGTLRFPYA